MASQLSLRLACSTGSKRDLQLPALPVLVLGKTRSQRQGSGIFMLGGEAVGQASATTSPDVDLLASLVSDIFPTLFIFLMSSYAVSAGYCHKTRYKGRPPVAPCISLCPQHSLDVEVELEDVRLRT